MKVHPYTTAGAEVGYGSVKLSVHVAGETELRELCKRLDTDTVTEISRDTGIPRGTIYESIKKLRAIFEDAGLRDYL